jgi:phosphopantetheine--protein transferase-like protein
MKTLNEFLKNLTGKDKVSLSELSSAQKARVIAWARAEKIPLNEDYEITHNIKGEHDFSVEKSCSLEMFNIGIGIDIQSIADFFPTDISDLKGDKSLLQIFTMAEISYAESTKAPLKHLTGIFALKEAVMKASKTMLDDLTQIEICHENSGQPRVSGYELSLSYTNDMAVAVAIRTFKEKNLRASTETVALIENLDNKLALIENRLEGLTRRIINFKLWTRIVLVFLAAAFLFCFIQDIVSL